MLLGLTVYEFYSTKLINGLKSGIVLIKWINKILNSYKFCCYIKYELLYCNPIARM